MFEADIIALLNPLVANQVFFDTLPDEYKVTTPVIIVQQVGGKAGWYVDQSLPSHKNARVQIMVWGRRRIDAAPLARLVENAIAASGMKAEPYGAPVALYQPDVKLFGSRQDFGFWYPDP